MERTRHPDRRQIKLQFLNLMGGRGSVPAARPAGHLGRDGARPSPV